MAFFAAQKLRKFHRRNCEKPYPSDQCPRHDLQLLRLSLLGIHYQHLPWHPKFGHHLNCKVRIFNLKRAKKRKSTSYLPSNLDINLDTIGCGERFLHLCDDRKRSPERLQLESFLWIIPKSSFVRITRKSGFIQTALLTHFIKLEIIYLPIVRIQRSDIPSYAFDFKV